MEDRQAPAESTVIMAPLPVGSPGLPGLAARAPLDGLLSEPHRYGFFQAVRLLYHVHGVPPRSGAAGLREPLRFTVPASLSFPPSELHSLVHDAGAAEHAARYSMSVNFVGLTGPSGVLPRHYTEWLIALHKARDPAARDFLDIFNHRLIGLFWRAWAKHRTELSEEFGAHRINGGHHILRHVYDLIGLGTPALHALARPHRSDTHKHKLPGTALGYYSGLVAQRPHGVGALTQVVGDVVGAAVDLIGCHGTWQSIPRADRTRLGRSNQRFGDGCVLGHRYWDRQTTVRLRIGPLSLRRFDALLPHRELLGAVVELLRFLTGLALDLDIQLLLRAEAVPAARIGGRQPARIGWNCWLGGRRSEQPADECRFVFMGL
ncbi:type VI secretion system baseplate subunit TssG [Dyella tabacisoli]|uniref:Type VI secretion system baseplate subunit TssG n=1 Tax=Dyella tabacisoli TaxID=2282381 RepID=A0A369UIM1_9GAMM|nr:type VI secretion system baseplate subunit TssG [Dyella tabacisoli]RDD80193.1 type VI secretion system baseplate subunit TssG [Dyella tabacisoli]